MARKKAHKQSLSTSGLKFRQIRLIMVSVASQYSVMQIYTVVKKYVTQIIEENLSYLGVG